jgi:leader peptidase (prepilin peptidase) / N-methyltransferase
MNVAWSAAGAVAALPAATVLRGRVYRLSVPAGASERASCLTCAGPLPWWPALRCWSCGAWLGVPVAIELTAAAVTALLFARFGTDPALAAFAYLGLIAVALAQVDDAVRRLPDSLTLPAYPALVLLLALAAAAGHDGAPLLRALLGALALGGGYLLLGLASGGQVGGGDIKLAGLVGLALGWLGWRTLITGAALGFLLAGAIAVALLATRRASRRSAISFGPYLLAGALLAALAGSAH